MPKIRKQAETFDEHVGNAVEAAMRAARLSQANLAEATGIPLSNLGRSIRGSRPLSVSEFERIAETVGVSAGDMAEAALTSFGGIDKLIAEHVGMSEVPVSLADHRRNRTPAEMTEEEHQELSNAAGTDSELEQDEPEQP